MDTKKHIEDYKKEWFQKVERDSSNLFNVAENALKQSESLKRVIIIKRLPRHDRSRDDILGIKSQLSEYANTCYDQLWLRNGRPENISIVELSSLESTGYLRNIIYGERTSENYDGIHLRGPHAVRHFSYRAVQAIRRVIISPAKSERKKEQDNHRNCPQAVFQSRQRSTNQRPAKSARYQSHTANDGYQSSVGTQEVRYSDVVKGGTKHDYNVPTQNKFNLLN